jgi:hypothetical protein
MLLYIFVSTDYILSQNLTEQKYICMQQTTVTRLTDISTLHISGGVMARHVSYKRSQGSHSSSYEDFCLLGYNIMQSTEN